MDAGTRLPLPSDALRAFMDALRGPWLHLHGAPSSVSVPAGKSAPRAAANAAAAAGAAGAAGGRDFEGLNFRQVQPRRGRGRPRGGRRPRRRRRPWPPPPPPQHMAAGAAAGVAEHVAMHPVDTVKTRMQALGHPGDALRGAGVRRALASVLRREGVRGLYGGVSAVALGAGCGGAARGGGGVGGPPTNPPAGGGGGPPKEIGSFCRSIRNRE